MRAKFGGELSFLVTEFTKMEAQLSLEVGGALMVSLDVLVSGVSCLPVEREKEHLGNSVRTPKLWGRRALLRGSALLASIFRRPASFLACFTALPSAACAEVSVELYSWRQLDCCLEILS